MHIRRFLFTLFAVVALSPPFLAAQVKASGTIPSAGGGASCVSINVDAQATVAIQITGTWSGTLQPKISVQGQSAANIQVTPSTSTTPASTITANGVYRSSVAGGSTFLVCGNTVASGTANIYLNATTASAGSGGIGGSGTGLPTASAAGQYPVSSAAGTTYVAQTKGWFDLKDYGCVADDSTDNATCFANAVAAVNSYAGNGIPTLFCGMGPGELAYKTTGGMNFTRSVMVQGDCTIDDALTSGILITLGPTGLAVQTAANSMLRSVSGITFIGGALGSTVGVDCPVYIADCQLINTQWYSYGTSTTWAFRAEGHNNAVTIANNRWWNMDNTNGRNFASSVDTSGAGSNTTFAYGNWIEGNPGGFGTSCGGIGLRIGGYHSNIFNNSLFGFGQNILISATNLGYGTKILGNTLDNDGCTHSAVNANIQFGDPSQTGTLNNFIIADNDNDPRGANSHLFDTSGDATSISYGTFIVDRNTNVVNSAVMTSIASLSGFTFHNNVNFTGLSTQFFGHLMTANGTAPTLACTGLGTGACALSGGTDTAWTVSLSPTGSPSASGNITLTFGQAFNTSPQTTDICIAGLANSTGTWNARATVILTAGGVSSNVFTWDNNAVALTAGQVYFVQGHCFAR